MSDPSIPADAPAALPVVELAIDELARRTGIPVRTIREYQSMGVLPPPERRGRIGIYRQFHLSRLELIARLQRRGYSLAGIRDLLASWQDGADLGEVLGLAPDELVHIDEPGMPATADQLARLLPSLVPERLGDLMATGVVEHCGPDRYCVPSPSLLQLTMDLQNAGFPPEQLLALLGSIGQAADTAADAVLRLLDERPADVDDERLATLIKRGRGLLAHGTGRLTVHTLGRRLGITGDEASIAALGRRLEKGLPPDASEQER
ncbi:MerR family transcriptional regulator [Nonomuraea sp. NPDC049480]|uniref:MerR family transcriptional regulator n=1 Tax=Nonomuraea sp. NPDC049480 TaxID=3364353 RepID=UPI003789BD03